MDALDDKAVLFEEYGNEVYSFDHTQIVYGLDACSILNLIADKGRKAKPRGEK